MRRAVLVSAAVAVVLSACGGGGFTQEELDAAVERAVEDALAETDASQPTAPPTTVPALTTTSAPEPLATTTSTPASTTTAAVELDESDPRNAEAVEGNAAPPLPVGDPDVLSVITAMYNSDTRFESTRVFFVVRNNTDNRLKDIEVALTVRDAGGGLLASGDSTDMYPYWVEPGEIAFGYSYLSDIALPSDAQFEFQIDTGGSDESAYDRIELQVQEHGLQGDNIIAILSNSHVGPVRLVQAGVMCFLEDGSISWFDEGFADLDSIAAGGTSPVTVDMRGSDCPIYLIASKGFEG